MIDTFTRAWFHSLHDMRTKYTAKAPENYAAIVKDVVTLVRDYMADQYEKPDPERITAIDHGDYQGTILFIVAADNYQPSKFWMSFVSYGSCSGCDTMEGIRGYRYGEEDDPVPSDEVDQYLALALHILQSFKALPGPYDE